MIYKCGEPVMEKVERVPYPKVNTFAAATYGDRKAIFNEPITHLNISSIREACDSYIKFTDENPTTFQSFIGFDLFDSEKFSKVPSNSTAFHSRKPFYNVNIFQRWKNEQDDEIVYDWSKSIQKIFSKDGYDDDNKPLYINFESKEYYNEEKMKRLFGRNLERLKELKRKYDQNVLFL